MSRGVFSVSRDIFDHPIVGRDPARLKAWLQMVAKACWKPTKFDVKGKTVTIDRGQFVTSYRQLSDDLEWSLGVTQRFLACLKADTMIDTATDTGQIVVTICNYEIYQLVPYGADTATDTPTDTAAKTVKKSPKTDTLNDTLNDTGKKVIDACSHGLSQTVHAGADTANDTLSGTQKNKKKKESKEEEKRATSVAPKKSTRLSDDWRLPKLWGLWAVEQGLPPERVRREALKFRNYWTAKAGKDAGKINWNRTWQNWCLNAMDYTKPQRKNGDDEFTQLMRLADDSDRRAAGDGEVDDGAGLQPDVPLMAR